MVRSNLPDAAQFLNRDVPGTDYRIGEILGTGCNAHVFVARSPSMAQEAACKVIPVTNLIGADSTPPRWQEEITKANRLGSRRVVQYWHVKSGTAPDGTECVFLLAERVRGRSLKEHLRQTKGALDVGFIEAFLGDMLDFLRELKVAGVQHGDFHSGNVLVEDRSDSLVGPPYAFRVTDFGVAPATTGATLLDDYDQLALMLRSLLERVDQQACSPRDRYAFSILNDDMLDRAIIERDPTRDDRARDPATLFRTLHEISTKFNARSVGVARKTLTTPFEYLSCEQIGESHGLLKELYSDRMLGLPDVEERCCVPRPGTRSVPRRMAGVVSA